MRASARLRVDVGIDPYGFFGIPIFVGDIHECPAGENGAVRNTTGDS